MCNAIVHLKGYPDEEGIKTTSTRNTAEIDEI